MKPAIRTQMKKTGRRIIYDFGANNGSDIGYYLLKADLVVAIEANPVLCERMTEKFSAEIRQGKVAIENCVVSGDRKKTAEFFIPLPGIAGLGDHHSTFKDPDTLPEPFRGRHKYEKILLRCAKASDIISSHGKPYYVKNDIEHADADILSEIFRAGYRPKYVSAESHSIRVLAELIVNGRYNHFKLVEGCSVSDIYRNRMYDPQRNRLRKAAKSKTQDSTGRESHHSSKDPHHHISFPFGSAGPFGEDVDGPWLSADELFDRLSASGLGWRDIHAKRVRDGSAE